MNKTIIQSAVALAFGVCAFGAQANTISNGQVLSINTGVPVLTTTGTGTTATTAVTGFSGSYFAMDTNASNAVEQYEKVSLSQGVQGLVLGSVQNMGGYDSHSGLAATVAGDSGNIVSPWDFFGNTGKNFTTSAANVISSTTTAATINLSGWNVAWNGVAAISMGSGAWGTGFTSGVAKVTMSGANYVLNYRGTVPMGDASGFGGVQYALHLEGTIGNGPAPTAVANLGPAPSAVPVPAAAWLLGSGLLGLVGVARRKQA